MLQACAAECDLTGSGSMSIDRHEEQNHNVDCTAGLGRPTGNLDSCPYAPLRNTGVPFALRRYFFCYLPCCKAGIERAGGVVDRFWMVLPF
jgi:hypothetical protein